MPTKQTESVPSFLQVYTQDVATAGNTRSFDRSALALTGEVFARYSTGSTQRPRTPQAIQLMMP